MEKYKEVIKIAVSSLTFVQPLSRILSRNIAVVFLAKEDITHYLPLGLPNQFL